MEGIWKANDLMPWDGLGLLSRYALPLDPALLPLHVTCHSEIVNGTVSCYRRLIIPFFPVSKKRPQNYSYRREGKMTWQGPNRRACHESKTYWNLPTYSGKASAEQEISINSIGGRREAFL